MTHSDNQKLFVQPLVVFRVGGDVMQLGLGTWGFSGDQRCGQRRLGWPPLSDKVKYDIIDTALASGITYIDTSDFYGLGAVEDLLGSATCKNTSISLCTKGGLINSFDYDGGQICRNFSPSYLESAIRGSLSRLRRSAIDIYQLHGPVLSDIKDVSLWSFLSREINAGRIQRVGVSVRPKHLTSAYKDILLHEDIVQSVQLPLSPTDNSFFDFAALLRHKGKIVIGRSPFTHGLLLRTQPLDIEENDPRRDFITPELLFSLSAARSSIGEIAMRLNCSFPQAVLHYISKIDVCDILLFGASRASHVVDNIKYPTV